ncbi:MAG: hypothetical protein R3174_15380, partial [Gammaproteobacteria bacterium]|nr:hypothetical protein [Gammaproteobacteria bacterium]
LWALRVIAGLLGAGNNGWGACALALIVPGIVGAVIAVVFGVVGLHPLIGAVIAFFVMIWLIAKFLETSMIRGFVIALLTNIVLVVLFVGGMFVLGMVFGVGLMGLMGLAMMGSQMGGQPGTMPFPDQQPQTVIIQEGSGQPAPSTGGGETGSAAPADEAAAAPATAPQQTQTRQVKYGFQEIDFDLVQGYLQGPVRLALKDGRVREGTLIGIEDDMLQISQKAGGGTMEYSVSKADIAKLEVWARLQ